MKRVFLYLLLIVILGFGSWIAGTLVHHAANRISSSDPDWDNGFRPAALLKQNHSFALFVCGYNNGASVDKLLRSICSQAYESYRLIYVDDASTDGSFEEARALIHQYGADQRTLLVHNEQRLGTLSNLMRAAYSCNEREILVVLNSDQRLAHEWVLDRLNQYYENPDLWLTYGQFRELPNLNLGEARNYRHSEWGQFRKASQIPMALPSFYAALFQRINEEDLIISDVMDLSGLENVYMWPLLEMAQNHVQFIQETLILAERKTLSAEDREKRQRCTNTLRSLKPYAPLTRLDTASITEADSSGGI